MSAGLQAPKPGQLKAFVIANMNPQASVTEESIRLMALAAEQKIKTTDGSLRQAIRTYRMFVPKTNGHSNGTNGKTHTPTETPITATELIHSDELLRRLNETRTTLLHLNSQVQAAVEVLGQLETEIITRRDRLAKFAAEVAAAATNLA